MSRFLERKEFYKNRGGYRLVEGEPGFYSISSAKKVHISTNTRNVQDLILALEYVMKSLTYKNGDQTVDRKALRKISELILPEKINQPLSIYMMTNNDFFVYPDTVFGDILVKDLEQVLQIMDVLEVEERERRYAFYIRFVEPMLDDYLNLMDVLKTTYHH